MKLIIVILIGSIVGIYAGTNSNLLVKLAQIKEYVQLNDYLTNQIELCQHKLNLYQNTNSNLDLESMKNSIQYYLK
jgi:hypothetical protein